MQELAKQWVASPHFGGWRVGMVSLETNRGGRVIGSTVCYIADPYLEWGGYVEGGGPDNPLPDLTHPGTVAFLLEDVRRAWGERAYITIESNECRVVRKGYQWFNVGATYAKGKTLAAALVAALLAAPEAT